MFSAWNSRLSLRCGISRTALASVALFSAVHPLRAQVPDRSLRALTIDRDLSVENFDDSVWNTASSATDLRQQEPEAGRPASLSTEARVIATPEALLLRFTMEEPASEFVAHELRRDAILAADDRICFVLDTYRDLRNAYAFCTNPNGIRVDGLITAEQDPSLDWDTVWDVRVRRTATGWDALFRIPFSALNYSGGSAPWGFNFSRDIRSRAEVDRWSGWRRPYTLAKVSQAGVLTGLPPMRSRRLRSLTPYASGAFDRRKNPSESDLLGRAGLDFRYGLSSSTEADLTVNTDFSETESDAQQFNFGRTALFFPEKRAFFLQRAPIFAFGSERTTLPFFSRRIGLKGDDAPVSIPIDAGVKLTGRVGNTDVGALAVQTRAAAGEPRTDFLVGRLQQDLGRSSYLGALVTDIERPNAEPARRSSRTFGADGAISITPEWTSTGYYVRTQNRGRNDRTAAWHGDLSYAGEYANGRVERTDIGSGYDPHMGFVSQNGIRSTFVDFELTPRPHALGLRNLSFETFYSFRYNEDHSLNEREYQYTMRAEWQNGAYSDNDIVDVFDENLTAPLELTNAVTIPIGVYHFARHQIAFGTNPSRALAFQANFNFGDYYGGRRDRYTGRLFWKPSEHVGLTAIEEYNVVRLRQGDFDLSLFSGRIDWNPSVRLLSSLIFQSDNVERLTSVKAVVRWLADPAMDLFFVYDRQIGAGFERPGTRVTIKIRKTFDL